MPNTAIGLTTGLATAEETVYGTIVTPDRAVEFTSESLERQNQITTSKGLRSQTINLRRGSRRALTARDAKGNVKMEVPTVGFGRWLKQALGGTPTIAQQAASAAYLQTHNLGGCSGKSMTIQKQLRDSANAIVQQFTFMGCKIMSAEFTISVKNLLEASFDIDARDVDVSTAAATLTYPAAAGTFNFSQGTLKINGTSVAKVDDASVKLDRKSKTDGWYLGTGGLKSEPFENDFPEVMGSLSAEFDSAATFHSLFAADTAAALILEFVGPIIASTYAQTFRITVPEVHFTGETPKVGGPDVIVSKIPFEGANNGTLAGITCEYMSTDIAI